MARLILSTAVGIPARITEDMSAVGISVLVSHNDTGAPVVGLKQNNFHLIGNYGAWTFSVLTVSEGHPGHYGIGGQVQGPAPSPPGIEIIVAIRVAGPALHVPPRRRDPLPDQGQTLVKIRIEY
jgi:hypothetical protein